MIALTAEQLAKATGARIDRAEARLTAYRMVLEFYEINTRLRMACFLPNVGHECGGFKYREEIWGPTAQQLRYERDFTQPWPATAAQAALPQFHRNSLAWRLGNTKQGDGRRFAGHGDMQNTGRTNHALTRDRMRVRFPHLQVPDFEAEPEKLAELPWAAFSAGDFWDRNDINRYADAANFDACCDSVNRGRATLEPGDSNGFDHRLALFVTAMRVLP
jgi:putative chitinase